MKPHQGNGESESIPYQGHGSIQTSARASEPSHVLVMLVLAVTVATVFGLDCLTPLGFGTFVLYAPICLLYLWRIGWRAAYATGALCSLLIIVGLFLSPPGIPVLWSAVSRTLGILALWSVLWGGKLFAQRTIELERTKANLHQEIDKRTRAEQTLRVTNEQLESRVELRTALLKASLDRWELVTQATHDGVYDWDLTSRQVVHSSHWREMHGFVSEDDVETFEQWSERIHPDDRTRVLGNLENYLARKRPGFREEYRIRRRNDSWMWVLDRAYALWNENGRAVRLVGSEKNITERKRAEEMHRRHEAQLQDLTTKLLTAQERERQRIAREMHDDFTQRLAALAVDLGSIERSCSTDTTIRAQLQTLRETAAHLANDVHNFAYQLHPSILEHLGLETAIRDHIDEFMRRTGLTVRYVHRKVPKPIQTDVATCLYRVVQECLQNVFKHAEASNVLVRVLGTPTGVGVCVRDNGKGLSRSDAEIPPRGLGLISMEERVRLLNGRFRIRTEGGKGTEIHAWVPLSDSLGQPMVSHIR